MKSAQQSFSPLIGQGAPTVCKALIGLTTSCSVTCIGGIVSHPIYDMLCKLGLRRKCKRNGRKMSPTHVTLKAVVSWFWMAWANQTLRDKGRVGCGQEPITRSLHTNCILEWTISRIFLFLELWYLHIILNIIKLSSLSAITEILSCGLDMAYNNRWPCTDLLWLANLKTTERTHVGVASKNETIRDRVDSEGQYGRWKLRAICSWDEPFKK